MFIVQLNISDRIHELLHGLCFVIIKNYIGVATSYSLRWHKG